MKYLPATIITFVFFIAFILLMYSEYNYHSFQVFINSKESDCLTGLPSNIKLLYSKENNDYVVTRTDPEYGGKFLYMGSHSINWGYSPYDTFKDSCNAKSFFLEYQRDREEKIKSVSSYK